MCSFFIMVLITYGIMWVHHDHIIIVCTTRKFWTRTVRKYKVMVQDTWCCISYYPPEKQLSIVPSHISQHASFHESLTVNKNWTEQHRYFQLTPQSLCFLLLPEFTLMWDRCWEPARSSCPVMMQICHQSHQTHLVLIINTLKTNRAQDNHRSFERFIYRDVRLNKTLKRTRIKWWDKIAQSLLIKFRQNE